jgi:2,3-dihydroxybenzoate-AMP ligase
VLRTSAACILDHATARPDAIAVIEHPREITYRRFCDDTKRVTRALSQLAIPAGSAVAIEFDGLYRSWLLQIGCEHLGIATGHYAASSRPEHVETLLGAVTHVLHAETGPRNGKSNIHVGEDWWGATLSAASADLPAPPNGDFISRIATSSGTTGAIKLVPQTMRQIEARREHYIALLNLDAQSRYLLHFKFDVQAGHTRIGACLSAGGTVLFAPKLPVPEIFKQLRPNQFLVMPAQLRMLAALPAPVESQRVTIEVSGGRLPKQERARIAERIDCRLIETYTTNEAGAIAVLDEAGLGHIVPGVRVEIVDEADRPVAAGEQGRIRVSSPGCVEGYLSDPATSAKMFQNGWFYPGDIGVLGSNGRLRLLGRADDLLNWRGHKFNAAEMEDRLRTLPEIRDIGMTVLGTGKNYEQLALMIVPEPPLDKEELYEQLGKTFLRDFGKVSVRIVEDLPRTGTGKVQRHMLNARWHDED